jgi:hypothetical protein
MTAEEIVVAMRDANASGRRPQLCERLREMDPGTVFEALFPVAANSQGNGPAYRAACLLFVLKSACPIPCKEAIRALLRNWDISIEEVPWYLAGLFGREAMREAVEELSQEPLDREQHVRLNTVRYWTDIFFGLAPERLRELKRRAKRMDG